MEVPLLEQRCLWVQAQREQKKLGNHLPKYLVQLLVTYKGLFNCPLLLCIFFNLLLNTITSLDYSSGFIFPHVNLSFQLPIK